MIFTIVCRLFRRMFNCILIAHHTGQLLLGLIAQEWSTAICRKTLGFAQVPRNDDRCICFHVEESRADRRSTLKVVSSVNNLLVATSKGFATSSHMANHALDWEGAHTSTHKEGSMIVLKMPWYEHTKQSRSQLKRFVRLYINLWEDKYYGAIVYRPTFIAEYLPIKHTEITYLLYKFGEHDKRW